MSRTQIFIARDELVMAWPVDLNRLGGDHDKMEEFTSCLTLVRDAWSLAGLEDEVDLCCFQNAMGQRGKLFHKQVFAISCGLLEMFDPEVDGEMLLLAYIFKIWGAVDWWLFVRGFHRDAVGDETFNIPTKGSSLIMAVEAALLYMRRMADFDRKPTFYLNNDNIWFACAFLAAERLFECKEDTELYARRAGQLQYDLLKTAEEMTPLLLASKGI